MKKQLFLIAMTTLFAFSCSKDDSPSEPEIPAEEKLLESVESDGILPIDLMLQYNPNKTVESISAINAILIEFEYNDEQVSSIESVQEGQLINYSFQHDPNGILTSFATDGVETLVNYNPNTRTYDYLNSDDEEVSIQITTDGDVEEFSIYDPEFQETSSYAIQYEDSNLGAMANSNSVSLYLNIFYSDSFSGIFFYPLSKKPVKTLNTSQIILLFENDFDNQGFISQQKTADFEGNESTTTYNYFALEN